MNLPELPPELAPYAETIRAVWRPYVRLLRSPEAVRPWQSCLGGQIPYWPADRNYPRDERNRMLSFLLQLNFAEMPPLPDFPAEGLLQLFISCYHSPERAFVYTEGVSGIFHEKICTDPELLLSEADIKAMIAAEVFSKTEPEPLRRVGKPGGLAFSLAAAPPDQTDHAYRLAFGEAGLPAEIPAGFPQGNTMKEMAQRGSLYARTPYMLYRSITEMAQCSAVGGYGRFPQHDDPRAELPPDHDWMVLVKLLADPDFDMMWGDVQEFHVFIRRGDLLNRDFSSLWMYLAA